MFDSASLSKARKLFADLDNQISRDAAQRLKSSPQGSVLGALNSLFSPHPVSGAPSAQMASQSGLLGKMISQPGGGGPAGAAGGSVVRDVLAGPAAGNQNTTDQIRQVLTGTAASDQATTDRIKQVLTGNSPGNVSTEDMIRQVVTGKGPGDTTTRDTVKEALDPASKAKVIAEAGDMGGKSGASFSGMFTASARDLPDKVAGMIGGGGGASKIRDAASKSGGDSGDGFTRDFSAKIIGGIGPLIFGVSAKMALLVPAVGTALAVLPALMGVIGLGMGVAMIGGVLAGVVANSPELKKQFAGIGTDAKQLFTAIGKPIIPAISAALKQVGPLIKSLTPALSGIMKAIAPQISGIFAGIGPILKNLVAIMQAAAPAFGPFIEGLEKLVGNILPGLLAVIKPTIPFIRQFGAILGTLGSDLGKMFAAAAPAIGASMTVLGALLDLIGGLLPILVKLGGIFATALAPVITQFAGVIKSLMPTLIIVGKVLAELAGAIIGDLASALGAVATVLIDIAPALATFAGTLGLVFTTMENAGVFAILGNAVEALAGPLATMISALLNGLAPILPPIFTAIGQIAGLLAGGLAGAIIELLPPLTTLATNVLVAIAQLLPLILPWLVTLAGLFTSALVGVVKGVADGLSGIIKALPPQVLGGIAVTLAAIVLSVKALNLGKSAFAGLQSLYSGLKGLLGLGGGGAIATAGDEAAGAMKLAMQQGGAAAAAAIRDAMGLGGKTAGAEIAAGEETGGAAAGAEEGLGTGAGAAAGAAGKGGAAAEDAGAGLGAGAVLSSLILPAALAAGIIYALSKTKAAGGGSILAPAKGDLGVGGVWWNYIGKLLGPAGPLGAPKAGKAAAVAGGPSSYEAGGRGPGVPGASLAPVLPRLAPGDLAMLKSYAAMYGETLPAAYKTFADASVNVNSKFNGTGVAALDAQTRVGAVQAAFALLNAKGLSTAAIDNYTESFKLNGAAGKLTISDQTALVLQLMKTGLTYQQATADVDGMTTGLDGSQSAMATGAGARAQLISDIKAMHADTPKVNTDISNLAASIQQTGTNSAQTAGDRAQLIADLEKSGVNAQTATAMVDGPNGYIAALKNIPATEGTILTVKGLGKWAVSQTMTAQTDPYGSLQAKNAAGAFIRAGTGPTADDVLVRVSKGELIVPANMVAAGMVDNLKGMIPGFAGGGKVVSSGVPGAAAMEASDVQSTNSQIIATVKAQMMAYIKGQQAKAAAASAAGGVGLSGIPNSSARAALQAAAAAAGWTGAQWAALEQVEMREAGFNLTAQNPSSGAYGMAQFINGPSEYAQYGGNSTTAAGQAVAMVNYIKARYGTPEAAWAHEQSAGWYSKGGLIPGYASGGTIAREAAAYLKSWTGSGKPFINTQIDTWNADLHRDTVLGGAKGLSKAMHAHYLLAEASDKKHIASLTGERQVLRDWRTSLGGSDSSLSSWISAAGNTKALKGNVAAWKKQLAGQKAEIARVSFMLGLTPAEAQAAAAAKAAAGASSAPGDGSDGGSTTATPAPLTAASVIAALAGIGPQASMASSSPTWYGSGGTINEPVIGFGASGKAYGFGERGSETVTPGGGASIADVCKRLERLIAVTAAVPAGVGNSVGGAIGGASAAASFRTRYPRSN